MVITCVCTFVCLCVCALKGKRLELLTPKLVGTDVAPWQPVAVLTKSGQNSKVTKLQSYLKKIIVARSLVRCVSADVIGLHVDMTAYVFHFLLRSPSSVADRVGL